MLLKTILAVVATAAIGLSGAAAQAGGPEYRHYAGGYVSSPWTIGYGLLDFTPTYYGVGYGNVYGYPGNYDRFGGCHVERQRMRTGRRLKWRSAEVCE
jgi:hypothetical protein